MMKQYFTVIIILFLLAIGHKYSFAEIQKKDEERSQRGPIAIRNQMPLYLFYLQMVPDKSRVVQRNKFEVNTEYTVSNVTVSAFTPVSSLYEIDIDLEVSRLTLDIRYGIYDNLELGLEIPYISLSSGYLDNVIEAVEDAMGARTPRSRERQGSYEFDYKFRYNYEYLIKEGHSKEGIGDIVLNLKYQLIKEEGWFLPNFSLRSAVKFPTGEKDDLLGSGEFDYGFGVLLDKGLFDRLFFYVGANIIVIKKPSFFSKIGIDNEYYTWMLSTEYFFTKRFSFVTQVSGNTTPYPYSHTNVLDNDAYELAIGFNYIWKEKKDISWQFAIAENLRSASSPDVTIHSGLNWRF